MGGRQLVGLWGGGDGRSVEWGGLSSGGKGVTELKIAL